MKGIDFKSAVIGLLVGVCLMLALGAGGGQIADIGRYKVSAAWNLSSACFVIDTATGRTWIRRSSSNGSDMGSPEEWDKE